MIIQNLPIEQEWNDFCMIPYSGSFFKSPKHKKPGE